MYILQIKFLVLQFRKAIELLEEQEQFIHIGLKRYPKGSCGLVTEFLGRYLLENDIQSYYICGFKDGGSHAWLKVGNSIINITGDQFDCCDDKVYFGKYSMERLGFVGKENDIRKVLMTAFDGYLVKNQMYHDYNLIIENIKNMIN